MPRGSMLPSVDLTEVVDSRSVSLRGTRLLDSVSSPPIPDLRPCTPPLLLPLVVPLVVGPTRRDPEKDRALDCRTACGVGVWLAHGTCCDHAHGNAQPPVSAPKPHGITVPWPDRPRTGRGANAVLAAGRPQLHPRVPRIPSDESRDLQGLHRHTPTLADAPPPATRSGPR